MDPLGLKIIFVTCLVFVPLERLFALRPGQKVFRQHWGNDLIFLLLNGILIKLGLLAVIALSIFAASRVVPASWQATIGGLPYWVQLPLLIVVSDLGFYWTHRMFHAVPWLWRFHAVHHSIEELDWLAAARVHPVDQILTKGVSLVPIVALGFSEWAIGVYALLYQWQSVLIHANVRIGFGPFRLLFASPEFHHWHHSNDREARDRNFAGQLTFLDALFGTLHMPRGQMPKDLWTGPADAAALRAATVASLHRRRGASIHAGGDAAHRSCGRTCRRRSFASHQIGVGFNSMSPVRD
jgi:sterol desaturase/sphingolipid hydroxylase (fatty acid hydroxylase superfamily)